MNQFKFSIIMAVSKNGVIGVNGKLPFSMSEDLKRFKRLTTGKTIVMGSATFRSIGSKPLPNRKNIVLTSKQYHSDNHNLVFCDLGFLEDENKLFENRDNLFKNDISDSNEIMIIGGSRVYHEFLPHVTKVYLTLVDCTVDNADTFFDHTLFFREEWAQISKEFVPKDSKNQFDSNFFVFEKC